MFSSRRLNLFFLLVGLLAQGARGADRLAAKVEAFIAKLCAGYQGTLPRLPELYAQVRCPTLALWGERDKHFPTAHAERLHRLIPGSRLEVVAGAEHWMPWYMADEIASRVRGFVQGFSRG